MEEARWFEIKSRFRESWLERLFFVLQNGEKRLELEPVVVSDRTLIIKLVLG